MKYSDFEIIGKVNNYTLAVVTIKPNWLERLIFRYKEGSCYLFREGELFWRYLDSGKEVDYKVYDSHLSCIAKEKLKELLIGRGRG